IDATLWPTYDFLSVAKQYGLRYFTLAFITADSTDQPAWGGYREYAVGSNGTYETALKQQIAGVRQLGGDVFISFGGAAGQELAQKITDITALKNAYAKVVTRYGATHLDFDIEGAACADRISVDRRSQALALLQKEFGEKGINLHLHLTLPVLPSGLTPDGLYVVQSAKKFGVQLEGVNIMAMDYGDSAAPNPQGRMGDYSIQAARSLQQQLRSVYGSSLNDAALWKMIGLTPMIGLNDVTTEVFDQQEAREMLAFASEVNLGRISMWSLNRDQQNPAGKLNYVDLKSSSILQSYLEFSLMWNKFTGS
ncbi:MAG: chitinase, partial [Gemmataceae bacterium]